MANMQDILNQLGFANMDSSTKDYFDKLQPQQVPGFIGATGPDGKLLPQYQLNAQGPVSYKGNLDSLNQMLQGIQLNKNPLNKLEDYATSTSNSPWADLQLQMEQQQRGKQLNDAAANSNAGVAKAYSSLAAHGGASAGARERIAGQSEKDLMNTRQGINQAGDTNRLGIMSTDASNKLQTLQGLPAAEVAALQPDLQKSNLWSQMATTDSQNTLNADLSNRAYQTGVDQSNIQNLLGNNTALNAYNMAKYSEQMKAWGSQQTANATEKSGKK